MIPGNFTVRTALHGSAVEVVTVKRFEMQCDAMDTPAVAYNHTQE
jgi:hypothetical protein